MRSCILLIYTGGTIGMKTDPFTGVLSPFDFNDLYEEFPYLKKLGVDIEIMTFKPMDSSNVTPELWIQLARIIYDNYDSFDGFVILHGTDTMSYTASALSFMLENLTKPVVFTGSQIPIGVMRTDGRENLITAVEIAAAKNENGDSLVPEVCLYFQNKLFRGNRTTKYSAEDLNAFRSDNYPALADVGVNIVYNLQSIMRTSLSKGEFTIGTELENNILLIKIFPGMTEGVFRNIFSSDNVRGIVIETYGSGNAPNTGWFIESVKNAVNRGIPVMNITQCKNGSVSMGRYETSLELKGAGVVNGRDCTAEAALTKMMYLLGKSLKQSELNILLGSSLRGEISL